MACEETVKQVCEQMRKFCSCGYLAGQGNMDFFADDILAAHKREIASKDAEIARLRECLREATEWACGNPDESCEECVSHGGDTPCKCEKWRKAMEGGAE